MKQQILYTLPIVLGAVVAGPVHLRKREVPQEHAHQAVLDQIDQLLAANNPDNIQSSVFGLLGAKAAAEGAGSISDPDCLQQATADQAFSNAKAANDVAGQTAALIYRGLERNSGSVGLASPACTSIKAVNAEIAAISQHQDPAGDGAQAANKQVTLAIAQQIAAIGGNPQDALEAGTFAPGQIGDPTAKGNTCDDANDKKGCIDSQNLRVDDATAAEIDAAASGSASVSAAGNATAAAAGNSTLAARWSVYKRANATAGAAGAADFGSCTDPSIKFGIPSDRSEDAFFASDQTNFNHGSALNIKVISQFICDQLTNKCKASADAVSTCDAAATSSASLTGQAAADAFNSALGV